MKVRDKEFEISISSENIQSEVSKLSEQINKDLADKDPLFIVILNGSFMFAADLFKQVNIPCEITFVKLASYQGTESTENIKTLIGLSNNIKNRTVVIVEDIVDTGYTIKHITETLNNLEPKEIKVCTLLYKLDACRIKIKLDYVGFNIPNEFVVGYGLDYDGYGRNLPEIYATKNL